MSIHVGTRLSGKVDQVPGLFYVATEFFHLQFIPLIPLRSHVIFDGTEKDETFSGVLITLSGKSVLFAWLRAFCWVAGVAAGIFAVIEFCSALARNGSGPIALGLALITGVVFYVLWASYRWARARPLRALELAKLADVAPEVVAEHFVDYPNLDSLLEELIHEKEALHR
jgi:hypothetical protein